MVNISYYWGDPDSVFYFDEYGNKYSLDYSVHGYTFGIWKNVLVCGNDDDDTATLPHCDLLTYYIYYHGWPSKFGSIGGDILPIKDVAPDCDLCDWNSLKSILVRYEYDDDFDEGEDRMSYADLISSLGKPRCRGRILYDYIRDVSFIAIWDLDKNPVSNDDLSRVCRAYGGLASEAYFVLFNNQEKAFEYFSSHEKPTLMDVINGKVDMSIKDNNVSGFALHLMGSKDKWNSTDAFRRNRDELNGRKLGNMTRAEYNSLIYQEGINDELIDSIINENINKILRNG